jgi:lipopolysaccharide biosynthesis regulator YciM
VSDALANVRWEIVAACAGVLALAAAIWRRRRSGGKLRDEFDAYAETLRALLRDDLDPAVRALTRAAEINSDRAFTYLALGQLLRQRGEFGRARRIHESLSVRPGLSADLRLEAQRETARDELLASRPREALARIHPLLEKHRKDPALLSMAEEAHLGVGEWDAALDAGRRLDRVTGRARPALRAHLLTEHGRQLVAEGDLPAAKKVLQKAIDACPESAEALTALAEVYLAEAKPKKAIETWERVLDLDPRWIAWLTPRLEQACFEAGQVERLEPLIRKEIGRRPGEVGLHLLLARHLAKKQRLEDALGALKQAVDIAPDSATVRRERVRLLLERGGGADFEAEVDALIRALPADPPAFRCVTCRATAAVPTWRCAQCGAPDSIRWNDSPPTD